MTTALLDDAAERQRDEFDRWYVAHAFNYEAAPIGSRDCGLQWQAWKAATEAAALKWQAEIKSLRRILREHAIHEFPDDEMVQCAECGNVWRKGFPEDHGFSVPEEELCAAAIRGGNL